MHGCLRRKMDESLAIPPSHTLQDTSHCRLPRNLPLRLFCCCFVDARRRKLGGGHDSPRRGRNMKTPRPSWRRPTRPTENAAPRRPGRRQTPRRSLPAEEETWSLPLPSSSPYSIENGCKAPTSNQSLQAAAGFSRLQFLFCLPERRPLFRTYRPRQSNSPVRHPRNNA